MEKAFDLKALVEELKAQGLPVAEEAAKVVVQSVLTWVEKSVVATESKYDDFALAIIPLLRLLFLKN